MAKGVAVLNSSEGVSGTIQFTQENQGIYLFVYQFFTKNKLC